MESKPVEVYPVHDYLRSRLCTLYENDSIFDRFECGWNGDDSYPWSIPITYCNVEIYYSVARGNIAGRFPFLKFPFHCL